MGLRFHRRRWVMRLARLVIAVHVVLAVGTSGARKVAAETIGFECPNLGALERLVLDPFVDCVIPNVTLTAEPSGFGDEVVGLVKDMTTSACIDPPSDNQLLAAGRAYLENIGLAVGIPLRATFSPAISLNSIALPFQTLEGRTLRVRVYDEGGVLISSADTPAEPPAGDCALPGGPRALTTVFVPVDPAACIGYVIMDVDPAAVFVIDSFTFVSSGGLAAAASQCGPVETQPTTWGRLKMLYR